MGTNYYFKKGKTTCHCCGSEIDKEYHIGKKSYGWEFSFEENRDFNLYSCKDYLNFLQNNKIKIYNEYQDEISIIDFRKLVLSSKDGKNKNHTVYVEKDCRSIVDDCYICTDGFSFSKTEFS